MNRNRSPFVITAAILVALGALVTYFSGYYVDWLWFQSVDFTDVWTTVLATKIQLFLVVGIVTSLIISSFIALSLISTPTSANAASPKAGTKCTMSGQKVTSNNLTFTCTKSGKNLMPKLK